MPSAVRTALATLAAALLLSTPAMAAPVRPPSGIPSRPDSVATAHFVVHYTTTGSDATTPATAQQLADHAETAYAWIVGTWGYPPPKDDGDGKTDIYVATLPGVGAATGPDNGAPATSTAFLIINPPNMSTVYPVAHEFFHAIQMGVYQHEEGWLDEGTAEWVGQNVVVATGGEAPPNWYPSPWVPLNCMGDTCSDQDVGGYRSSIFFEYLDEKYGMDLVRDVYQRAAAAGAGTYVAHSLQVLSDAIAARGGNLSDDLSGFAIAATSGQILRPGVTSKRPRTWASYTTGTNVGRMPPITLGVDHLSFKGLFVMGASPYDHPSSCSSRRLDVEIPLPGVPTQPALVHGSTVTPLTATDGVARASTPWSTCYNSNAVLVVPNGSTTADGQAFPVTFTLVDTEPPYTDQNQDTPAPVPTTRLTVKAKARTRGRVSLRVTTAKAGTLTVKATTRVNRRTRTYASTKKTVRRAGTMTVTLIPTKTAAKLLKAKRRLTLRIVVRFTPKTGARRTVVTSCTIRSR